MKMQLTNNNDSMLSLTKSVGIASSATSTMSIKTNSFGKTFDERFVVQKASSLEDGFSSEAISSCSDSNDDKSSKIPPRKLNESIDEVSFDESSESDRDSIMDNFDVTFVDDSDSFAPKNDAERMFLEVVEFLRIEQEVKFELAECLIYFIAENVHRKGVNTQKKENSSRPALFYVDEWVLLHFYSLLIDIHYIFTALRDENLNFRIFNRLQPLLRALEMNMESSSSSRCNKRHQIRFENESSVKNWVLEDPENFRSRLHFPFFYGFSFVYLYELLDYKIHKFPYLVSLICKSNVSHKCE